MFGRHKTSSITSQNSTLHLLKSCSSHSNFQTPSPSFSSSSSLFKVLASKNRRMKGNRVVHESIPTFFIDPTVLQELDIAMGELTQKNPSLENQIKPSATQTIQSFLSSNNYTIPERIKKVSQQANDLTRTLSLQWNSQESYQDLLDCFQHILDEQEPISILSLQQPPKPANLVLKDYKKLFIYLQDNNPPLDFFSKCFELIKSSSILPTRTYANKYFLLINNYFQTKLQKLDHQTFKTSLHELPILQKYCEQLSERTQENFGGRLSDQKFWMKMEYLIRRSSKYHQLIEVHLRQKQQHSLLQYFTKVVKGQKAEYQVDPYLFQHNPHYKNFVLILQRRWTESIGESPLTEQLLGTIIKQIQLKICFHQNYQIELQFLRKYSSQLTLSLEREINHNNNDQKIMPVLKGLLHLGQFSVVIALLEKTGKLDTLEALINTIILFSLDLSRCELLLYNHTSTIAVFTRLLQTLFSSEGSYLQLAEILSALRPVFCMSSNQIPTLIHLLTIKESFFTFIVNELSPLIYLQSLQLTLQHLPLILESLINKHASFGYCAKIALSTCISMTGLQQVLSKQQPLPHSRMRTQFVESQKFQLIKRSDSFKGVDCSNLPYERRLQILVDFIDILTKNNVRLCLQANKRHKHTKEALVASQLLCLFLQKTYKSLFNQEQQISNTNNSLSHLYKVQVHLRALAFSTALLTIKHSISCSQYSSIVKVLNDFLDEIAPHYQIILRSLSQTLGASLTVELTKLLIELIIQGVLGLRQSRPKIVRLNELLLKEVARQLMGLLIKCRQYYPQDQEIQGLWSVQETLQQLVRKIVN